MPLSQGEREWAGQRRPVGNLRGDRLRNSHLLDHCRRTDTRGRRTSGVWSFMALREHRWWKTTSVADQDSFSGCTGPGVPTLRKKRVPGTALLAWRDEGTAPPPCPQQTELKRHTIPGLEGTSGIAWRHFPVQSCYLLNATPHVNGRAKTRTQARTSQASTLPLASRTH